MSCPGIISAYRQILAVILKYPDKILRYYKPLSIRAAERLTKWFIETVPVRLMI